MSGKFWTDGPMVVTGCTKVSPGCRGCWSEQAHIMRAKNPALQHIWPADCLTDGRFNGKVHFNLEALKRAIKGKKPKVIAIWNDLYHEGVTDEQVMSVIKLAQETSHTVLIITKRPKRAVRLLNGRLNTGVLTDNVWHIVTMESQAMVDERMPHLLSIPGKRGIIIEPMLGAVDLGGCMDHSTEANQGDVRPWLDGIHQVLLGGETGRDARPLNPVWVRGVRDQCARADVPFYFKSWGEYIKIEPSTSDYRRMTRDERERVGRLLNGVEHNNLAWKNIV